MKVGVIMGGISSEREISLKSGKSIIENIDKNKYENLYHIHFCLYNILSFFKLQYFIYTPS